MARGGARPGDWIFVSGTLGDAAQGLRLLESAGIKGLGWGAGPLLRAFLDPVPRLELGALLARKRLASAMIDLSDGLSVDLAHICEESGVGAEVEAAAVPLSPAIRRWSMNPLAAALGGGEDFELLFTVRPAKRAAVESLPPKFRLTRIGRVTTAKKLVLVAPDGKKEPFGAGGFEHFSGRGARRLRSACCVRNESSRRRGRRR